MPLLEMYTTGVTFVIGRVNARETIPHVLNLVRAGQFKPEQFTTLKARWDDAPEALLTRTTKAILTRE